MKLPYRLGKCVELSQNATGQKIGLGKKSVAFESFIQTFIGDPLHVLLCDLKIAEHLPFQSRAPGCLARAVFVPAQCP